MALLLMTGTIRPAAGAKELPRMDVHDRIADYRKGLIHNIGLLRSGAIDGLVFAENSGYGMEPFAGIVSDADVGSRVELISYDAQQSASESRFMGEINLLRNTLERSDLFARTAASHVWKVTGRYVVRNLPRILRSSEGEYDLILHCRNRPIDYVDFGLAGFRCTMARKILDIIGSVNGLQDTDERIIRRLMADGSLDEFRVRPRFSHIPDFSGIRGSDNSSYQGVRYRIRYGVRAASHRLFPQLWI